MRKLLIALLLLAAGVAHAQVQKEDGKWWDNNLAFHVKNEQVKTKGQLEICIFDTSRDVCVENLMTSYEVRIFDATNKEIWNSLWTGKNMNMKFSKPLPTAHHVVIKAMKPFVINQLTTTRIFQDNPLELKYNLQ